MTVRSKELIIALIFLMPNFLGFLVFIFVPIVISFFGSFSSWSLQPSIPLEFIGFAHYKRLLTEKQFYFYFFNTAYFMLTLPLSMFGSLLLAVLLSERFTFRGKVNRKSLTLLSIVITLVGTVVLTFADHQNLAYFIAALGTFTALGFYFGSLSYRTVFYLPHFTAGAATILLWTQLYNPHYGLVNQAIEGAASHLGFNVEPPSWLNSTKSLLGFLPLPDYFNNGGFGLGAREAIMIMGLWAAIGGNQMLLYLAGISNIPKDLYEAAEIDGATWWQRFIHITVPQVAPITFFIFVMGVIHGLQGGFEAVRMMTEGGPAGITTTLTYYIYVQGFERLDLGYGSAVAWVLFFIILAVTLVSWKYGNKEYY